MNVSALHNDFVSVKDETFGAVGNGTKDDSLAIQAAIDSASAGAVVFPQGVYRCTQSIGWTNKSISLVSLHPNTQLIFENCDGIVIDNSGLAERTPYKIESLRIRTNQIGLHKAIQFTGPGPANTSIGPQLTLRDCFIHGTTNRNAWDVCVELVDGSSSYIENCTFRGANPDLTATRSGVICDDSTNVRIHNSYLYWLDTGIDIRNTCEGIYAAYCVFGVVKVGVTSENNGAGNWFQVIGCHINGQRAGVILGKPGTSGSNHSRVRDNLIFKNESSTEDFVGISICADRCFVSGNEVMFSGMSGAKTGISVCGSPGFESGYNKIVDNLISNQDCAIYLNADTVRNTVSLNRGFNNAADISDFGRRNSVTNNDF